MLPHLDERQRRLFVASEAQAIGRGGITVVHKASRISRVTIAQGMKELNTVPFPEGRSRKAGGGKKNIQITQPGIDTALEELIEPTTRGDPESSLRWTTKSTRVLAGKLKQKGYQISHTKVAKLLHEKDYSLQANKKTDEGKTHKDRDAQFHYINNRSKEYSQRGFPVLSVDTKKKELVGKFKNNGRTWRKKRNPDLVKVYDFLSQAKGKAVPYGVYDIAKNNGWVNVGMNYDTAEFSVESMRQWWRQLGKKQYPKAKNLLVTADCGGSNGNRTRLWKKELQAFANETGLEITVCHLPPGTSKWNKIEHRLFSFISKNWQGKSLVDYETIIQLISATRTETGLKVYARLDTNTYEKGKKVTDEEMSMVNLEKHTFHGEWNYTIRPNKNREL